MSTHSVPLSYSNTINFNVAGYGQSLDMLVPPAEAIACADIECWLRAGPGPGQTGRPGTLSSGLYLLLQV